MKVIVLALDAIHLHYLGPYGSDFVDTPNLDRLAFEGFVFDQHQSADPTGGIIDRSSRPLFDQFLRSGKVRSLHLKEQSKSSSSSVAELSFNSVEHFAIPEFDPADLVTLPQLREVDEYRLPAESHPDFERVCQRYREELTYRLQFLETAGEPSSQEEPWAIGRMLDRAFNWLDADKGVPALVWLDLAFHAGIWTAPLNFHAKYFEGTELTPHPSPFAGRLGEEYRTADLEAIRLTYAGRVGYFDSFVGRLLERIRQSPFGAETAIVVTAANGYPLGEHGNIGIARRWLYEEFVHVPLLIWGPGVSAGSRHLGLSSSAAFASTLIDMLTDSSLNTVPLNSLWPIVKGESDQPIECVVTVTNEEAALRTVDWKLVLPLGPAEESQNRSRELFAKPEDRWEVHNLAQIQTDRADDLEEKLRAYLG